MQQLSPLTLQHLASEDRHTRGWLRARMPSALRLAQQLQREAAGRAPLPPHLRPPPPPEQLGPWLYTTQLGQDGGVSAVLRCPAPGTTPQDVKAAGEGAAAPGAASSGPGRSGTKGDEAAPGLKSGAPAQQQAQGMQVVLDERTLGACATQAAAVSGLRLGERWEKRLDQAEGQQIWHVLKQLSIAPNWRLVDDCLNC